MKVITSKHFFFFYKGRCFTFVFNSGKDFYVIPRGNVLLIFQGRHFCVVDVFSLTFSFPLQGERSFAQRGNCFRILLSRVFDKVTVMENRWIDEVFVVLISTQFPVLSVTNCKFQVNSTFDLSETNSTCAPFCKTHVANLETETKIVASCFRSAS